MCVSALKVVILLNCPQINPVGLKYSVLRKVLLSIQDTICYGKCKHVDCIQGLPKVERS